MSPQSLGLEAMAEKRKKREEGNEEVGQARMMRRTRWMRMRMGMGRR